jgi:hypothetical protein
MCGLRMVRLTGPLEESVVFGEVADGMWQGYFGPLRIGRFDEPLLRVIDRHDGTTSHNPRRVLPMSVD